MSSLIGSIFSDATDVSVDQTVAYNAAAGAAVSAQAYLTAAISATTPEVRRLFSEYSTQSVMGNEIMMGIMMKNGWVKPYDTPENQLQGAVQQSKPAVKSQH